VLWFRRSAHRRFIASAIALRPSGLNLRFVLAATGAAAGAAEAAAVLAFLLPLGRPRPLFGASAPLNSAFACCSFAISASICAITSVSANGIPPGFGMTQCERSKALWIDRQRQLITKEYSFTYSTTNGLNFKLTEAQTSFPKWNLLKRY
jgi:hypothetical protein